jgi:hypothetical protein
MPRMKGETNEQWMQRLRDFRADRDSMMQHTRAAVCFANSARGDDGIKLAGFMHLFHPEVPQETVRQMVHDARRRR